MGRRGLVSFAVVVAAGVIAAAQAPQSGDRRLPRIVAAGSASGALLLRTLDATVDSMRRSGELVLSRTRTDTVLLAPAGQAPQLLETAAVPGDAEAIARMGRYLLAGTLLLDVQGRRVDLPLSDPADGSEKPWHQIAVPAAASVR